MDYATFKSQMNSKLDAAGVTDAAARNQINSELDDHYQKMGAGAAGAGIDWSKWLNIISIIINSIAKTA